MLFNSLDFAIFLPIVFLLYWFVFNHNIKLQNLFIVVVSYIFYGWWDWRFLLLMGFTTLASWFSGVLIVKIRDKVKEEKKLKRYSLWVTAGNIILNLGILCYYKYFNFFIEAFVDAFALFGRELNIHTLKIILPVGISFYTFQALSYTIDVYKKKLEPTKDVVSFFAFVSFFPQLVAGPIERAINLLPQFYKKRVFEYDKAVDGMRQILWGLFKKMAIADNCAICTDHIFENYETLPASSLILGAFFFSVQIYCDFSGYSDIAIGTARLFGVNLMRNFAYPYFSRDIAEFWRRWHISLTTWFRDYIYIPLGGSRVCKSKVIRNTFIVYLVSGFWHGANWTFIVWGLINAIYFIPLLLGGKNRKYLNVVAEGKILPNIKETWQMLSTFVLAMFAWIFFRAESIAQAGDYIKRIFDKSIISFPFEAFHSGLIILLLILILFTVEWMQRDCQHGLDVVKIKNRHIRWLIYVFVVWLIFNYGGAEAPFIYFQF
ncbi:alginate O-acetyltransferase complex protein AlgI [Dysgonomonadaceae bacterium PH5-43]|nr:alginate O-acetyltransferase complex protein AlgI [Dysgonomonadaceae bacterium PH5-43]